MGTQVEKANFTNYKPIVIGLTVTVVVLIAVKIFIKNKIK